MNRLCSGLLRVVVFLCVTHSLQADELVIEGFDQSGQLRFGEIPSATVYRVEWSSSAGGPWFSFSDAARTMDRIWAQGSGSITSSVPMCYRVVATMLPPEPPAPDSMVLIPAGSFRMGDPLGEGFAIETPVHTATVSAFFIGKHEVTKAQWKLIYDWAVANGYEFDSSGYAKGDEHPVTLVTWYDAVKWCNARSEREGRAPAYYTSAAKRIVYRVGELDIQNDWVRWQAGYRLPTEAEWEKAARGGLSDQRFPWGPTINHARANYYANGSTFAYDISPYTSYTYHPDYFTGGFPYSSPVGSFSPNTFGLYDMVGNVWERCWDRYDAGYYAVSPATDPRGPPSGSYRVLRGGAWNSYASSCRAAYRFDFPPEGWGSHIGFRTVLPVR